MNDLVHTFTVDPETGRCERVARLPRPSPFDPAEATYVAIYHGLIAGWGATPAAAAAAAASSVSHVAVRRATPYDHSLLPTIRGRRLPDTEPELLLRIRTDCRRLLWGLDYDADVLPPDFVEYRSADWAYLTGLPDPGYDDIEGALERRIRDIDAELAELRGWRQRQGVLPLTAEPA